MYSLIRGEDVPGRLAREVPALASSIAIAELFYKFHSFSLECLAFLATWFAISGVVHAIVPPGRRADPA